MLAVALLITATPNQPINLDDLSIRRARTPDGQRVLVSLKIGKTALYVERFDCGRHRRQTGWSEANRGPGGQGVRCGGE